VARAARPRAASTHRLASGSKIWTWSSCTTALRTTGGLLSKGHPLGATGLAQCYELTQQLRGTAGALQVKDARLALAHNLELGGACVVTLFEAAGKA